MSKLYHDYLNEGKQKLTKELNLTNVMCVPKLSKIVINTGLGEALQDKKVVETVSGQLAAISGQKPAVTRAKKDISAFKVRRGDAIGLKVTLRGSKMYDFFEKLVTIVLPRIRDFRGVSKTGFDGRGNYTLGLSEQIVFPEIDYSQIDKVRGLEITFVTSGRNDKEAKSLLEVLGIPFSR